MLSKSSQYGIRVVLRLAVRNEVNRKAGVHELAEELKVPKHFLAKILQQLVKADLVSSVKGPGGGFYLTSKNKQHSLADIVKIFDGNSFFTGCILGLPNCSATAPCPLHNQFAAYREGLSYLLQDQSIGLFEERLRNNPQRLI